jgi:tripartite-type tricarboxylate transporter receptor subunit TctC
MTRAISNHSVLRRSLLQAVLPTVAVLTGVMPFGACAQEDYPKVKPIRLVIPFASGGATDVLGRLIGGELAKVLGQTVIVENKAGAAGVIGTDMVAKSAPDGYTICFCTTGPQVILPHLTKLPFNPQKDLLPVIHLHNVPNVLLARSDLEANSVKEVVALAKAKPGKISYATTGQGGPQHLAGEQFQSLAGIRLNHVPYKGENPAFNDLMGGVVDLAFGSVSVAQPLLHSGKIKAIAVTSRQRSPALPNVPTVAESGYPNYEAFTFVGLNVPSGTPQAIVERLNSAANQVLATPAVRERMIAMSIEPVGGTPKAYADYLQREYGKLGQIIRDGRIELKD